MGGHGNYRPTKYFSIDDIPDDMVARHSKRDPNNPIYKTRRWVDFKKRQILYSQQDGVPVHLRTPMARFMYYSTWASIVGCFAYNIYLLNKLSNKK